MPKTPTFGRYAEIPYNEMTPEQQEGYRFLVETRGAAGGQSKIWVHNPKLVKASAPLGAYFHPGGYSLSEREMPSSSSTANGLRPTRPKRTSGGARNSDCPPQRSRRPSSSAPIKREYPATSAARIAVRRRTA